MAPVSQDMLDYPVKPLSLILPSTQLCSYIAALTDRIHIQQLCIQVLFVVFSSKFKTSQT